MPDEPSLAIATLSGILEAAGVRVAELRQRALDPRPLGGQQLACSLGIHAATLTNEGVPRLDRRAGRER